MHCCQSSQLGVVKCTKTIERLLILLSTVVLALTLAVAIVGAAESVSGFTYAPEQSLLRAEAGMSAAGGRVLAWNPDLDAASVAAGYDYTVAGTIYRWADKPGAAVWYNDSGKLSIDVTLPKKSAGTLRLYLQDYTNEGRIEQVELNQRFIAEISDFSKGVWLEIPVTADDTTEGVVSLLIRKVAGPNPILQALEFVPAPLDVVAGLNGPTGQVLEWNAAHDVVRSLTDGYGYSVEGTIYRWNDTTAVWYADKLLKLHVNVPTNTTGILGLYLEAGGRDQTISVDGNEVGRYGDFGSGAWILVPVTAEVSADGVLDVDVKLNGGANAVVNRLQFLPGIPPPPPTGPQEVVIKAGAKATVGEPTTWISTLDEASLLPGFRYGLVLGQAWKLADGKSAWVEPDTIQVQLQMREKQQGTLWLYMEDFENAGRAQTIAVQGNTMASVQNFAHGLWVGIPITEDTSASGVVGVAIMATDGPDAIISELKFVPAMAQ